MAVRTIAFRKIPRKLTAKQAEVLRLIRAGRLHSTLDQHWTYSDGERVITAVVMGLSAKALVVLHPDGTVSANERGLRALSNDDGDGRFGDDGHGRPH